MGLRRASKRKRSGMSSKEAVVQREFRIFDLNTRELERVIEVTEKSPRLREKVRDGLYRKVDFERFYVEEFVGGYSINSSKGAILDALAQDRLQHFSAKQMAQSTGYSVNWCRLTAAVLARKGEIRGHRDPRGMMWSLAG